MFGNLRHAKLQNQEAAGKRRLQESCKPKASLSDTAYSRLKSDLAGPPSLKVKASEQ